MKKETPTRRYTRTVVEGRILIVTIHRPEFHNALNPDAHEELQRVFDDFAENHELWVAIITGAGGKSFCTGNDLKALANTPPGERKEFPRSGFAGMTSRFDLTKPVIAAVNGYAFGGGFELALACDLIVASENAVFALPEPLVGVAAAAGGPHRLARAIPLKQAMGMLLTGRRVTAVEGERIGFVNEVVAEGEALAASRLLAERILRCSPMSLRATKDMVQRGLAYTSLQAAVVADYPTLNELRRSEDFREGPRAFVEKRPPQWVGR